MRHSGLGALISMAAVLFWSCQGSGQKEAPVASGPRSESRASSAPPVPDERPVIMALGDSLTAGRGVEAADNYPARLQRKIDEGRFGYRVVNEGVSGDTSAQGLSRLSALLRWRPALAIVELGANDGLRGLPVEDTRRNLAGIIRELQSNGVMVVLAGMQVPPNYGSEYVRNFSRMFTELAQTYHVALVPFFLEGVGGRAELNQDDGIHPTAAGYAIVTENVWKVLAPLLRKQRQSPKSPN